MVGSPKAAIAAAVVVLVEGEEVASGGGSFAGFLDTDINSDGDCDSTAPRPSAAGSGGGLLRCLRRLRANVFKKDTALLLVPQMLLTMQNFLIFVGLSNLDAVTFQVWSQTKLLSAALFSVWMLGRHLTWGQWLSLALLAFGVLFTQLNNMGLFILDPTAAVKSLVGAALTPSTTAVATSTTATVTSAVSSASPVSHGDTGGGRGNQLVGIAACVLSGLSSSYTGVFFEKVVKTTSPTLAIRNIQLSLFGIPLALFSMTVLDVLPSWREQSLCGQPLHWNVMAPPPPDWRRSATVGAIGAALQPGVTVPCPVKPFFLWQHYDAWLTWGLVVVHALGGLLVAIVVRYAANILKGFATGIAVIVNGLMSAAIWGYKPTPQFALGAMLVTSAPIMFRKCEKKR